MHLLIAVEDGAGEIAPVPGSQGRRVFSGAAVLSRADIRDAQLPGAPLFGAFPGEADLRGADLTGAKLWEAALALAYLTDAALIRVDLTGARLEGVKLDGADPRDSSQIDLMGREIRCGLSGLW